MEYSKEQFVCVFQQINSMQKADEEGKKENSELEGTF